MKLMSHFSKVFITLALLNSYAVAEFVAIGNAGNAADSTGYGAVGYNYSMGKTEVSLSDYQLSGLGGGGSNGPDGPAVSISWHQAARYCNWLTSGDTDIGAYSVDGSGNITGVTAHSGLAMDALVSTYGVVYVLPTEDEWYKAAYFNGSTYSTYATVSGAAPTAGTDAAFNNLPSASGPQNVDFGTLERNGTLGMSGNVWEWMESSFSGAAFNSADSNQQMAVRSGSYLTPASFLENTTRLDNGAVVRNLESIDLGFRVVAIPEPGTISLMSLSTIGLFITRSVRRRKRVGQSLMPIQREVYCDTFISEDEWLKRNEFSDELVEETESYFIPMLKEAYATVKDSYGRLDKVFWNWMVQKHELRVERRKLAQAALKKKALDGLDLILSKVMK